MALQFGVSYKGGDYEYVRVRRWPFSIGRNPANDLCLANSPLISRRHARICKATEGYCLVAQGRNPTYLNGTRVRPEHPVPIRPGDRIELPDYLLEVRDTSEKDEIGATVNVEMVSNSVIITRRIASELGMSRWSASAIHEWLSTRSGREIRISHHHVALCLPARLDLPQLEQQLGLFDQLISHLDPRALVIERIDPMRPASEPV